mmetsp:Transcript_13312/g.29099  ORF Transcript_13312/g.29099 Transcript_13312/m.29099 type:complete len:324 (-) Transcript_13312:473-1444(-)|eukprot:CAMPEP_0206426832 /NCGR_PEP_ID=MMETSP0324_2-20121206/4640_1 /ASSEMBLY_ACC=CAM_ASM_000836 /TAXON_ID=2866 /ORGANISM="Crypthecodinium cohnii, Strain Seligo" /LENGTH=323 /DNA_ID=CAMNT_0053891917 /DNA_START=138 /DNA_END=1109 /DNA_ORIENTATION=-
MVPSPALDINAVQDANGRKRTSTARSPDRGHRRSSQNHRSSGHGGQTREFLHPSPVLLGTTSEGTKNTHQLQTTTTTTTSKKDKRFVLPTTATTVAIVWKDVSQSWTSHAGYTLKPPERATYPGPEDPVPSQLRNSIPRPTWYFLLKSLQTMAEKHKEMERQHGFFSRLMGSDESEEALAQQTRAMEEQFIDSHHEMLGANLELEFRSWKPAKSLAARLLPPAQQAEVRWLEVRKPKLKPALKSSSKLNLEEDVSPGRLDVITSPPPPPQKAVVNASRGPQLMQQPLPQPEQRQRAREERRRRPSIEPQERHFDSSHDDLQHY